MQPLARSWSPHAPTQALLDALREGGWHLVHIQDDTAVLNHPDHPDEALTVTVDPDRTDRAACVTINGRVMPITWVTYLVRSAG